jgi:hypothetical protein
MYPEIPRSHTGTFDWPSSTGNSFPHTHKDYDLPVKVRVFHFPSNLNPCTALVMSCPRINFVGPPSSMLSCGSWELYADSIFVFDAIERHLNAVVYLPAEPLRQSVVFAHSYSPFLKDLETRSQLRAVPYLQLLWNGATMQLLIFMRLWKLT